MIRSGCLAIVVTCFLATANAYAGPTNLVVNGGFETGDFTGWTLGANSFPQYIVSSPVHSGNFAAQITGFTFNPDTISQTLSTVAGQTYNVDFFLYDTPGVNFNFVYWNGTLEYSDPLTVVSSYFEGSFDVVGTGSDTLLFISANNPGFVYLDDVSVIGAAAAVPEPWSLSALGSGLLIMGACSAIRRRAEASRRS